MKKILVLGAGLVARPLVRYLLDQSDFTVTVASRTIHKAEVLIDSHPRGSTQQINASDDQALATVIANVDIVISLLPWVHHLKVARLCLSHNKHLVTTSYVKPEMQALNDESKSRGLLFLNEIGVDPGIDHMAAMRVIGKVRAEGGEIVSFYSYCGGLPALPYNNNPLGYKFSWSPTGVMLAALNNARYLKDGRILEVPDAKLFEHYWLVDVPGAGTLEAYVNRDALPYRELYGIPSVNSLYRGTLRNIGHCEFWSYLKRLDLLNQDIRFDFSRMSPRKVLASLIQSNANGHLPEAVASYLKIPAHAVTIKKMAWLGLFSDQLQPLDNGSAFDLLAHLLQSKLTFGDGELDLLLQHHVFIAAYPDGLRQQLTATMVETGMPGGDSAMARTVSLPAAIATRLILEGRIGLTGVHIPVKAEIFEPVLDELKSLNIELVERSYPIS